MTTTISFGGGASSFTPLLLGYESSRPSGSIVHAIPGSNVPAVTVATAGLRVGTLTLGFTTEAAALTAEQMLETAVTFTLADTTYSSMGMNFVTVDNVTRTLDVTTLAAWQVTVGFQEIM